MPACRESSGVKVHGKCNECACLLITSYNLPELAKIMSPLSMFTGFNIYKKMIVNFHRMARGPVYIPPSVSWGTNHNLIHGYTIGFPQSVCCGLVVFAFCI